MVGMDAKDRIIAEQRVLIEELRREIEELKLALAKATKGFSNSSKSPSSDITKPPKKKSGGGKATRKKRKRGGQPGRKRKLRQPMPPERVDEAFAGARAVALCVAQHERHNVARAQLPWLDGFAPEARPAGRQCVFPFLGFRLP